MIGFLPGVRALMVALLLTAHEFFGAETAPKPDQTIQALSLQTPYIYRLGSTIYACTGRLWICGSGSSDCFVKKDLHQKLRK